MSNTKGEHGETLYQVQYMPDQGYAHVWGNPFDDDVKERCIVVSAKTQAKKLPDGVDDYARELVDALRNMPTSEGWNIEIVVAVNKAHKKPQFIA